MDPAGPHRLRHLAGLLVGELAEHGFDRQFLQTPGVLPVAEHRHDQIGSAQFRAQAHIEDRTLAGAAGAVEHGQLAGADMIGDDSAILASPKKILLVSLVERFEADIGTVLRFVARRHS